MAVSASTIPSGTTTRLPMGSHGNFSFISCATMSVPPVVAPCENTMPSPAPIMAPPQMAASMGSMGWKVCTAAMMSTAAELTAMENREETSRWNPINFHPARNSGIFRRMAATPTGRAGNSTFSTCARPVIPPMPTALTAKNQSKDSANITEPTVMIP